MTNSETLVPDLRAQSRDEIAARVARAQDLIPAGCHTYSKGDDQFPAIAPKAIDRGKGVRVWDLDDREYLDVGMGLRSVILGHAYEPVLAAVRRELERGSNFSRPSPLETALAERLCELIPSAEMVKLAKDGSDVTSGAVRLARAYTERPLLAVCREHPFFSFNDWFIGSTPCHNGIPDDVRRLTLQFSYNDIDSLAALFRDHPREVAAVVLEPVTSEEPRRDFLAKVRDLATSHGAVLIFDEMITGFRYHLRGAQALYGVTPDLATFGKAIGNGFSVSALVGRRDVMELGGLRHRRRRTFLLSATHGGETHAIAAALATLDAVERHAVPDHLTRIGSRFIDGFNRLAARAGLAPRVRAYGFAQSPYLAFLERDHSTSFRMRTLFAQEMIRRGVLFPGYVSFALEHTEREIDEFLAAAEAALEACAMADHADDYSSLIGPPVKPVFRDYN
jgi:glutamate-1-semialdehyde 2,1-aminomutase